MKIRKANAGALTNSEVLDFLRLRGAAKDPTLVITSVAPSEFKVFDYLERSTSCNQTRESIQEFVETCKKYDLVKAEVLNVINIRPSSVVEIDPIIEQCESRMGESMEELVDLVAEVLPPPPTQMDSDEEIVDVQQKETS